MQAQAERWSPWLARLVALLPAGEPWLIHAHPAAGALWLLDALLARDPDAIVVGVATHDPAGVEAARALARARERRHGVPSSAEGTSLVELATRIAAEHPALRPSAIILHGLERNPAAVALLAPLARVGVRIAAVQIGADPPVLATPHVVDGDALALTPAEAEHLAEGFPVDAQALRTAVAGRIEAFVDALVPHGFTYRPALAFLPRDLRPHDADLTPVERVRFHERLGAVIDAFEVAVRDAPDLAVPAIRSAGPAYVERGMSARLLEVLAHLPSGIVDGSDDLVRFGLDAALVCGRAREWRPRVERLLAERVAPEVRALHAHAYFTPDRLERTAEALAACETPLTLRMHAFSVGLAGGDDWPDLLDRAFKAAEARGDASEVVAAASDRANLCVRDAEYHGGSIWARRAIEEYDRRRLRDPFRRLAALSIRLYAGLLVADDDALPALADTASELAAGADAGVPTGDGLVSTIGDHAFALGRFEAAEAAYRQVWGTSQPELRFDAAPELVMTLHRLDRADEAFALAREAVALTRANEPRVQAVADLAYAWTIGERPDLRSEAIAVAEGASRVFAESGQPHRIAQASILLARLHLAAGHVGAAAAALRRSASVCRDLGSVGWRLLGGAHPDVPDVRALARVEVPDLRLTFFGSPTALLRGNPIAIGAKGAECLCILSLRREGMNLERLHLALYGDTGSTVTTRSLVSRLRDQGLPILARPYRIDGSYDSDLERAQAALARNDVAAALALVTGPLLPASDAPEIGAIRDQFTETLRRALLASRYGELALDYHRRIDPDDLEIVEHALARLPDDHLAVASLRAREALLLRELEEI